MTEQKTTDGLIPPDPDQCQAEVPNEHTFMTLGGVPGRVRCKKRPSVIVTENSPGEDGKRGYMSLCAECVEVFKKQMSGVEVTYWQKKV